MSEDKPKIDPKYYKASGAPGLMPPARAAFNWLLWSGLVAVAVGLVAIALGNPFLIDSLVIAAAPLLAGAGIVAGLGKRE